MKDAILAVPMTTFLEAISLTVLITLLFLFYRIKKVYQMKVISSFSLY